MNVSSICIVGQDKRLDAIEHFFYDLGYDIYRDMEDSDKHSLIIMPPPVNVDTVKNLKKNIKKGQILYGGAVNEAVFDYLTDCTIYDYLKWADVVSANAYLTAKGIIKEAVEANAVFQEANCLVTGYGYCGKEIASELKKIFSNVDIAVRRKELKKEIEENYGQYIDINCLNKHNMKKYSYIFNTVPAMIFDKNVINSLATDAMIFDIASKPGGTDFLYCKEKNIYAINSLGIPGKEYPVEAGKIIANAIYEHIISL